MVLATDVVTGGVLEDVEVKVVVELLDVAVEFLKVKRTPFELTANRYPLFNARFVFIEAPEG